MNSLKIVLYYFQIQIELCFFFLVFINLKRGAYAIDNIDRLIVYLSH